MYVCVKAAERRALPAAGDAPPARGGHRQSVQKAGRHPGLAHPPGGTRPRGLGQEGKGGGAGGWGRGES